MTDGNGNGNGQQHRVRAQSIDTADTTSYCYAISPDGGLLLADRHDVEPDGVGRLWTTVWESVPAGSVVLRVVKFSESGGFWTPLELPESQTEAQVLATEKLLRLHNLSLVAVVGKPQKWLKGGRHQ